MYDKGEVIPKTLDASKVFGLPTKIKSHGHMEYQHEVVNDTVNITVISSSYPLKSAAPRPVMEAALLTVLFVAGSLCNILTTLVLRKRNSLGSKLLLCLTYVDLLLILLVYLEIVLPHLMPNEPDIVVTFQSLMPFLHPLMRTVFTAQVFVTVLVGVQRTLILAVPLRFIRFTRHSVFNRALIGVFLFAVVFNIPEFISHRPELYWNENKNMTLVRPSNVSIIVEDDYQLIKILVDTILPLAIIVTCDVIMGISSVRSVPGFGEEGRSRGRNQLTKIIVSITTVTIMLDISVACIYGVVTFDVHLSVGTKHYLHCMLLAILFTNSSINFTFYCLFGPEFRKTLKSLFIRRRH